MGLTIKYGWGGFVDGKLDCALPSEEDATTDFGMAIYTSKTEAQRHYEDVRRVEIKLMQ